MVTRECAYYKGELWNAYELKDEKGDYFEEYRLLMRKESQNNQFICPDCGENLILCAGPIMEPFFRHHENSNCSIISSERRLGRFLTARRQLYQLAKRSFRDSKITIGEKLNSHFRSGILIYHHEQVINIEFISYDMKLSEWEEKEEFYQDNNITSVWILSNDRYKKENLTTFEYLISTKSSPIIKLLDHNKSVLILKKYIDKLEDNRKIPITCEYNIDELVINENGEFDCDFELISQSEDEILNKEYRYIMSEKLEKENRRREELSQIRKESKELFQQSTVKTVMREKLYDNVSLSKNKMKLPSIQEVWTLPDLIGKDYEIKKGNEVRYSYLKTVDKEMKDLSKEQIKNRIDDVLTYLNSATNAKDWLYGRR